MMMVDGLLCVGVLGAVMWFLFPHAFLLPVMVIAGVLYLVACFARVTVVLDQPGGEVTIGFGWWTRHLPLTQIERAEVLGFGIEIAGRESYAFGPFRKRRWLQRWLRIRTGFEGMDRAVNEAAAAARAAGPDRAAAEDATGQCAASRGKVPAACFLCGAGALSLAVATAVRSQADDWVVHLAAALLRIYCVAAAVVAVLVAAWLVYGDRRAKRAA